VPREVDGPMTAEERTRIRLELARGHWRLGERDEALACLERVEDPAAQAADAAALLRELEQSADLDPGSPLAERLRGLAARFAPKLPISPLATPTLATLLAEQGRDRDALAVADQLLQRDPEDPRALAVRQRIAASATRRRAAIARLERWLANVRRNAQGDAWA
jgi:tetratricopeptide (TPR) repeat protein